MKKQWLIYILLLFVLVMPQAVCAMPYGGLWAMADSVAVADSVKAPENENGNIVYRSENKGFDARNFAFQKRYRIPVKTKFDNSNFLSHLYFGFGAGVEQINRRGKYHYNAGSSYTLFVGKDVARDHSVSLALRFGSNGVKNDDVELDKFGAQLNYHFNLTRYFLGYNPNRLIDVSTTLGVGYQRANVWQETTHSVYGMVGLRNTVRLSNRVHLALEPYMLFASSGYNGMQKNTSSYGYNASYVIALSMIYTIKNEFMGIAADEKPMFDRHYMFVEGGFQSIHSDIKLSENFGRYFAFGYGYWFARHLGLQFAAGYSSGNWDKYTTPASVSKGHPQYDYLSKVQYFFGRAEVVANLLTLPFKVKDYEKKFYLGLSAGYEYGFQWKYTETSRQTSCYYGGLTSAIQVKWLLPEGKALYLAPRITFVNFGVPYKYPYDYIEKKYTDKRFNLTLGLEFGLKRRPYEKRENEHPRYKFKENGKIRFRQALNIYTSFGTNYVMERGRYKGKYIMNMNGAFAFEYQPLKYFGIRLKTDYTTHNFNDVGSYIESINGLWFKYEGLWHIKYKVINGICDLKFDLSNMIHGYNPYRKWDIALYGGVLMSKHLPFETEINEGELRLQGSTVTVDRRYPKGIQYGIHAALNGKYSITRRWGVFAELGVKIHQNAYMWAPKIDYNPLRVLDLECGVSFKIR